MTSSILGVCRTDRIRNMELHFKIRVADVGAKAKTAKLKWECTNNDEPKSLPIRFRGMAIEAEADGKEMADQPWTHMKASGMCMLLTETSGRKKAFAQQWDTQ